MEYMRAVTILSRFHLILCILSVLGRYFALLDVFGSLYCVFVFLTLRSRSCISPVGSIVNWCTVYYSTRIACMFPYARDAWCAFPKRHHACYGGSAVIRKVTILGRYKWYQSQVERYPRVLSACRITSPMVVAVV